MFWLWFAGGIAIALLLYSILSVLFAHLFTNLQSNPGVRDISTTPAARGLPYEDVSFPAAGDALRISGWLIPRPERATAIVMLPAGGGNRLFIPGGLDIAHTLWERGHTILLHDPRGTGRSEGSRTSYGSLEARDLIGALRFLAERGYPAQRVGVVSWSMGGAAAMFALKNVTYGCLVMDSPLASFTLNDVSRYVSRGLGVPAPMALLTSAIMLPGVFTAARLLWGMNLHAEATEALLSHLVPTLVIHGNADTQVSPSASRKVVAACGDHLISAHFLDGVGHTKAYAADPQWWLKTVGDALDKALTKQEDAGAQSEHS
jgi:alpha-beta hydrolase superfamily lysophospholipase